MLSILQAKLYQCALTATSPFLSMRLGPGNKRTIAYCRLSSETCTVRDAYGHSLGSAREIAPIFNSRSNSCYINCRLAKKINLSLCKKGLAAPVFIVYLIIKVGPRSALLAANDVEEISRNLNQLLLDFCRHR